MTGTAKLNTFGGLTSAKNAGQAGQVILFAYISGLLRMRHVPLPGNASPGDDDEDGEQK